MSLLNQQEIEERMYRGGIARATRMIQNAEDAGEATRNPYTATIMRDYVLPLSALIRDDIKAQKPGKFQAHAALLAPLDADAVAYLAIRATLNTLLNGGSNGTLRQTAGAVGATVHQELVLAQIEHLAPDLYHTLANDFNRRHSKSVRHRMTVFKLQAAKAGIELAQWGVGARDQVGVYLLDQLARLGAVEIDPPARHPDGRKRGGKMAPLGIRLSQTVMETIDKITGYVTLTAPVYGPCVEPPLDWTGMSGGGFHTPDMQRAHPFLVKAHSTARELLRGHEMPTVWGGINHMQKTAWRVNRRILDTVRAVAAQRDAGEIVTTREIGKPPVPAWLAEETDPDARTEYQTEEFRAWKRTMAEWHTQRKLRGTQYGRFYSATKAAEMFMEYPELFFVYFLDSRGRCYPLTYGLNPQGSDLQKALLQFAHGKPLLTPHAKRWFLIHGANKWGFDKATLEERAQWARDRHDQIIAMAADPVGNAEWAECDNPLQFLAWCFEYAEWQRLGDDFESRVAVSMDGSCNGLQNFSAMLRDEVGGRATNLTDNAQMQDIYRLVAEAATVRMRKVAEPSSLEARWLQHGIERGVVKRPVMTTPYGITKRSAVTYIVEDYLAKGKCPLFDKTEYYPAAQALITHAWPAIADVVVKSREAMDWLKESAKRIIKTRGIDAEGVIHWLTPSGFLATQAYHEIEEHRIKTRLHGVTRLVVVSETDEASVTRHSTGLAPNFVHSMDASHLHLVASAAKAVGIDALAMIHDDYGTHAADAQTLFTLIRVQFLDMYVRNDPIAEFAALYPECPTPPQKGNLDLTEVLASDYFFS